MGENYMGKVRYLALVLAAVMLASPLMSCSKSKSKVTKVKEDDPWFDSVRFGMETDKLDTETLESSVVSYSNGKIYHIYSLTNLADFDNYRRSLLDIYDEEGKLLSRVKLKDPDTYSISRIKSVTPDSEGKEAEAVAELFAPGSFETAVVKIDLTTGEVKEPKLFKDKDGNTLEISDGQMSWAGVAEVYKAGEYYIPVIYTQSTASGNSAHAFAFRGSGYLSELDFGGIAEVYQVEEFSFDPGSGNVYTVGYTRADGPLVLEFDPETGKRISSEKYSVQSDEVNLSDFRSVQGGGLCKIDTLGNITTFDINSKEIKTLVDNNWYTPYFSDLSQEVSLVYCDEDTSVIYSWKWTEYSMLFAGINENVTILKKSDKNPHAGKEVIELATPVDREISEYLSNAIYEFNRTDNDYLIRVWSKYKTGIKAGRDFSMLNIDDEKVYTMIQELKGSEAPDLAIGIQKNYAMRDDVFEDLTGYLEQEVKDKQFANIIDAARIGDKQYFLPVTIEIEGLVTDTSLLNDGARGITFEDYEKMIQEDLDGFSPYDYPLSTYDYKKDFILSCIDTKSAIEGDSVNFGTDQFRAAAEFSNEYFVKDGFTKPDDYVWDDEVKRARSACRYDRIESYVEFIHACKSSEGSYTIIGTPSVDASGPRFRALETISVTSSSGVKDGCKRFINYLFAGAGFVDSSREFQNIVTNKEIMKRNISLITEKNNTGEQVDETMTDYMTGLGDYQSVYGYKKATADMEEQMMAGLLSISTYYYDDPVITAFIVEEIAPYYAGDRSLDDVVRILNDRTGKYVKEM